MQNKEQHYRVINVSVFKCKCLVKLEKVKTGVIFARFCLLIGRSSNDLTLINFSRPRQCFLLKPVHLGLSMIGLYFPTSGPILTQSLGLSVCIQLTRGNKVYLKNYIMVLQGAKYSKTNNFMRMKNQNIHRQPDFSLFCNMQLL